MSDLKCRPRLSARENSSLHTPHFTVPLDLNIMSCASYSKKSVRIINTLWNTLCRNLVVDIDLTSVFLIQPLPPPSCFLPPPPHSLHPPHPPTPSLPPSLPPSTHSLCFARRALRARSAFPHKISSWNGNFLRAPAHWLATIGFWEIWQQR